MAMFSSRDSSEHPWRVGDEITVHQFDGSDITVVVRDRPQHNPTNPILTEFRKYNEGRTVWLAGHWTKEHNWPEMVLSDLSDEPLGSPEQEDHAYKVLTRLANLSN